MTVDIATDDVVTGTVFVHQLEECLLDARTLFVDGIVEWIDEMVDAFFNLFFVHVAGDGHVIGAQLVAMFGESLELDALGMGEEEQVDGFVDGLEFNLLVLLGEHEAIVFRDEQWAELPACGLYSEFLEQGHSDGFQQEVGAALRPQLLHLSAQCLRDVVWFLFGDIFVRGHRWWLVEGGTFILRGR